MSTANVVPETWELDGDDARATLRGASFVRVARDAALRFRWADGFSHSRALAFQIVLSFVPGVVVLVGIASLARSSAFSTTIVNTITALVPGAVGAVFQQAAAHGRGVGDRGHDVAALVAGSFALIVSGATAFGQIERGANRIYGVEQDRPSLEKYRRAVALTLTVGGLLAVAFALLAAGRAAEQHIDSSIARTAWAIGRWPLGVASLAVAFAVMFKVCPRRRQPALSWLLVGALVAVALDIVSSALLGWYLDVSGTFASTYGTLAGYVGLMFWAYLVSIGLYGGLAFAAQLEAVRAGRARPQSIAKVRTTEPRAELDAEAAAARRN